METFKIIVLGCTGGPRETNLSGYLLTPVEKEQLIALDAGSLLGGMEIAEKKQNLLEFNLNDPILKPSGELLRNRLKAYLISHAHLDHIAGLVSNSQVDTPKPILGIDPTIDNLRDHIFNGRIWPNYGNEGVDPKINQYQYVRLPLHRKIAIPQTSLNVEAFLLSHPHGYPSTAFLIEYEGKYILYLGDTSSDSMEVEKHLKRIWERIGPLVQDKKLHGILLECSYSLEQSHSCIYGHLDPKLMMQELHHLADISQTNLEGLKLVVTHRKESLNRGPEMKEIIMQELNAMNDLAIKLIFPQQGDKIFL